MVCAFLIVRFTMLAAFFAITGGKEIASDVFFHKLIISEPLGILAGTAKLIASYPPFQFLVEWPLYNLFSAFFHEMLAIRLLMITVEALAFLILIYQSHRFFSTKTMATVTAILFIISPHQYFSTVFFVQEDIITQLFIVIATLLLITDKRALCISVLVLGVLIAKIFFVIPLFYVIFFHGRFVLGKRIIDGVVAIIPIAIVYYIIITNALINGGDVPIRDFTPDAAYAANYWVLILKANPDSLKMVKYTSILLSAIVQLLLIVYLFSIYKKSTKSLHPLVLLTIPLVFFFATFYQHMPEYFLILWPITAMLCTNIFQQLLLAVAFSLAWAPRVIHGIKTIKDSFGSTLEARSEILQPLLELVYFDMNTLHSFALGAQTLFYTVTMIYLAKLAYRKHYTTSTLQQ